jgi:predicted nucleic acid-binding protein
VALVVADHEHHDEAMSALAAEGLLARLDTLGVAGGAVYDALVGETAREHGLALATRDLRALETYRALDTRVELLS